MPGQARFADEVRKRSGWKCQTLSAAKHRQLGLAGLSCVVGTWVEERFLRLLLRPPLQLIDFFLPFKVRKFAHAGCANDFAFRSADINL